MSTDKDIKPKLAQWLKDEEPPISFYADLVEQGMVEVKYNENGGLIVTQGTQWEDDETNDRRRFGRYIINVILFMCGLLAIYTLHRISLAPIPCKLNNVEPCVQPGSYWRRILQRLLGMNSRQVRS